MLAAPPETAQDLIHISIPILKWEQDEDGDLVIKGIATDGTVDSDDQIVDPVWSAKALGEWLATGGNVRMSHDAHRPIGKGLKVEINKDGTDKHWLTAVIVDPLAQKLIKKGVLQAYSVGISRPVIKHDPRVRNGRICGGDFAEVSVVDRPSNKSSYLDIAKSAGSSCEFVQEMHATDEIIAKFSREDLITKDDSIPFADDMSFTFTPNDLAKILKSKIIEEHYDELAAKALYEAEEAVYKRNVSTAERRSLASEGNALSDGSYPIANSGDLHNAAHLAETGHGNAEGAKRLIARRAQELGVANPLNNDSSEDSGKGITSVVDETATPEVLKDDMTGMGMGASKDLDSAMLKEDGEDDAVVDSSSGEEKAAKKPKGKKMPPWLNGDDEKKPEGDDDDSCKMDHVHSEKCSGTPQSVTGVDAPAMDEIPNTGPALETPAPAGIRTADLKTVGGSPETAALMRFKAIGVDTDLGKLHDLTCPAYSPEEVAKYHPYADLSSVINLDVWQRKAVDAACGPLETAMELTKAWSAAQILKSADAAELNDYRLDMHKAFRDANPGPTSYPSPGSITPNGYNRALITAGHEASSPGHDGPNSSPDVATGPPNASHFDRPPLASGQQTPSPSFMKGGAEYPTEQGVPTRIDYAHVEREKARQALSLMHDNVSRMFPPLCPMMPNVAQPETRPVPPAAGLGKQVEPAETAAVVSKAGEAPEVSPEFLALAEKGMKKKLGKKVLAGKMTVDEARTKLGRKVTQKALEMQQAELIKTQFEKGAITRDEALKALGFEIETPAIPVEKAIEAPEIVKAAIPELSPDIIKSAIAEAIAPLVAQINKQQETITEQEARWEAAANAADPKTTSWAGLAMKSAQPVAVTKQAEIAEHTQQMINRQLSHIWRTSENPYEREAARNELDKRGGIAE
jgi:hypothetical protein